MLRDNDQNRDAVPAIVQTDGDESVAMEYLGGELFTPPESQALEVIELNATNAIAVDAALCDHHDTVMLVTNLNGLNPVYLDHLVETGRTVVMPYRFATTNQSHQQTGYSQTAGFISAATIAVLVFLASASMVVMPAVEIFFGRQLLT